MRQQLHGLPLIDRLIEFADRFPERIAPDAAATTASDALHTAPALAALCLNEPDFVGRMVPPAVIAIDRIGHRDHPELGDGSMITLLLYRHVANTARHRIEVGSLPGQ